MLDRYQAVFFDVGGTLLRVHPSVGDVYAEHARDFGFTGTGEELNRTFRQSWKAVGGMESLGQESGPAVERAFWHDMVFRSFDAVGGLERFDEYFELIYEVFRQKEAWRLYEDVEQSKILDTLKQRGVVMGIISNWDSRLPDILENLGLSHYFKFVLASTVVGSAKPDRKIFEEALKCCGVPAEAACHIGDEPDTDVRGARDMGIDAVLIDRDGRHPPGEAPVISSFHQLVGP